MKKNKLKKNNNNNNKFFLDVLNYPCRFLLFKNLVKQPKGTKK